MKTLIDIKIADALINGEPDREISHLETEEFDVSPRTHFTYLLKGKV